MKIFEAKRTEGVVEVKYRVKAESKEEAESKLFWLCGLRNLKIREL